MQALAGSAPFPSTHLHTYNHLPLGTDLATSNQAASRHPSSHPRAPPSFSSRSLLGVTTSLPDIRSTRSTGLWGPSLQVGTRACRAERPKVRACLPIGCVGGVQRLHHAGGTLRDSHTRLSRGQGPGCQPPPLGPGGIGQPIAARARHARESRRPIQQRLQLCLRRSGERPSVPPAPPSGATHQRRLSLAQNRCSTCSTLQVLRTSRSRSRRGHTARLAPSAAARRPGAPAPAPPRCPPCARRLACICGSAFGSRRQHEEVHVGLGAA